MGSWQTCVRARTQVQALILTVKDLKDLVTRKPAAEVELRAGQQWLRVVLAVHSTAGRVCLAAAPRHACSWLAASLMPLFTMHPARSAACGSHCVGFLYMLCLFQWAVLACFPAW